MLRGGEMDLDGTGTGARELVGRKRRYQAVAVIALLAVALGFGVVAQLTKGRTPCAKWSCATHNDAGTSPKTDPRLIAYKEIERLPTGLKTPRGIALGKDGAIYVAGDKAIRAFSRDFTLRRTIRLPAEPTCLAWGGGMLLVGMTDRVVVYRESGEVFSIWKPFGKDSYVTSISAYEWQVWVADAGRRLVYGCDISGKVYTTLGNRRRDGGTGFIVPSPHFDVAATPAGVWVADTGRHRLELFDSRGKMVRSWGKASFEIDGFCGCCNPADFALLPDGRFVTSEKGLPRVKVYSADGRFESVVAPAESFAEGTVGLDIAVDRQGHIYVLDPRARAVRVFVPWDGRRK